MPAVVVQEPPQRVEAPLSFPKAAAQPAPALSPLAGQYETGLGETGLCETVLGEMTRGETVLGETVDSLSPP